jgi:hypothetical protein
MKTAKICIKLTTPLFLVILCSAQEMICQGDFCSVNPRLNPTDLLSNYPSAFSFGNTTEDETNEDYLNQIMCPMLRLLRRTNMLSHSWLDPHYSIPSIVRAMTTNLGFNAVHGAAMLGLAKGVSTSQSARLDTLPGFVNLHQLHRVVGVSHASGYSFDGNSTRVDKDILESTITSLRALEDENGHLAFENLQLVKVGIAQERGVGISIPSGLETGFVWTICGGAARGYVETSDVESFLNGYLPYTIGEPDFLQWDWLRTNGHS